jgi:AcrR family transcriptional regulator
MDSEITYALMGTTLRPRRSYNTAFRRAQALATRRRILDAARRLFAERGYPGVTMRDVADAAGVAVQTVHAIFGTKLSLAQGIVEAAFEDVGPDVRLLVTQADLAQDPIVTLRTVGTIARRVNEHFADILLFLLQAGDPQLAAEAERFDIVRVESMAPVVSALGRAGVLRAGLSVKEVADLIWALTSPEWYGLLVRRRGWDPNRWEENLGDALVRLLLA